MAPNVLSATLSAVVQALIFAAVPFAAYIARPHAVDFSVYVGLTRPEKRVLGPTLLATAGVIPMLVAMQVLPGLREAALGPGTVAGGLRQAGVSPASIYVLFVAAWVQTSLSEELLFRGFIGPRLIKWWGFGTGNLLQAAVFGAAHVGVIAPMRAMPGFNPAVFLPTFVFTAGYGWVLGWLNEQGGNGSILPCWLVHGLANTVAWAVLAFVGP